MFLCCFQVLSDDITALQQKHTETLTKLTEYKRRFLDLSHRVLKVCIHHLDDTLENLSNN